MAVYVHLFPNKLMNVKAAIFRSIGSSDKLSNPCFLMRDEKYSLSIFLNFNFKLYSYVCVFVLLDVQEVKVVLLLRVL